MSGVPVGLRERFVRLRDVASGTTSVFGSSRHAWRMDPPFDEAELRAIEKRVGLPLPTEARAFFGEVTRGPMGPDYGFVPPKKSPKTASDLVIADEGGGVAVVLVLSGRRKGAIVGVKGSKRTPRAPGFFAYVETWLAQAILEWAEARLFAALRAKKGAAVLPDLRDALALRATLGPPTERSLVVGSLVAAASGDGAKALELADAAAAAFVDVNADRRDEDHLAAEASERRARAALFRARVHLVAGADDDAEREIASALAEPDAWVSTLDEASALGRAARRPRRRG